MVTKIKGNTIKRRLIDFSCNKKRLSICIQERIMQFYFSIDYEKEYFLYRIGTFALSGGIHSSRSYDFNQDKIEERLGLDFDFTVLNIRLGFYFHPIIWDYKPKILK